jgi:hypothetical protein
MKNLLFIIFLFISCSSTNKEAQDKRVFDSFIGIPVEDIAKTLGKTYSYRQLPSDDSIMYLSYSKISMHFDKNDSYCDYKKSVYISTSTRDFYIFNYFKEVSFIIEKNYCTDWIAY